MLSLLTACLAALAVSAPARASYIANGATIVSASAALREEGDDNSNQGDVSTDGRYVVFRTLARNLFPSDVTDPPGEYYYGGIYRRDMATGALDLVALGDLRQEGTDTAEITGASSPSISGDGRYVAFFTGQALVPADTNGATDVYVRDMTLPLSDPHAFTLVSALDGTDTPATYTQPTPDRPGQDPGADVSPGTSISDDGSVVAFSVRDVGSDLAAGSIGGQVYVRNLSFKTTTLITRQLGSGAPIGAVGGQPPALGPVGLSADGTTVLWTGQDAQQQTPMLPQESSDARTFYYLWHRIADGPSAPTRRITGAVDLDDPGCTGSYTPSVSATGPCYGPLAYSEQGFGSIVDTPPSMSDDGYTIAFLTPAPVRGVDFGAVPDLWVTNMYPGASRKASSIELTREGTGRDPSDSAAIDGVSISPDGRFVALVTRRTKFILPALSLLGDVRAVPQTDDLYLVDLATHTIQRAVHNYGGSDPDGNIAVGVSMSQGARRIVFSSGADNLFFGDANQHSDVFSLDRLDAPPPDTSDEEPPAPDAPALLPPDLAPTPTGKLSASVRRAPAGKVRLQVKAPSKGTLTVTVRGKAPDKDGVPHGSAKVLGSAKVKVKTKKTVTVDVALAKRYRKGLRLAGSLDARADARFVPAKGAPLERDLGVRFKAPKK